MTNKGPRPHVFKGEIRYPKDIIPTGEIIRKILVDKKITINAMSILLGLKTSILSKIINGVRRLDDENAEKLEEALGLEPQYLINAEKQYRASISFRKASKGMVDNDEEDEYSDSMEKTKPKFKSEREIEQEYRNFHRSMRDYIQSLLTGNIAYVLISHSDTYALIAKVVNLNIRDYRETMFQSVDREIKKDFCILTVFEWGRGIPDGSPLNNLGCAIKKLYTTEEIEKRLQEIGSV